MERQVPDTMTTEENILLDCLVDHDHEFARQMLMEWLEEHGADKGISDWEDRAAMIREGLLRSETERRLTHDLYGTEDLDTPDSIKDSNGEVVLGLCRRCHAGERELFEESCNARLIRRRHEGPCPTCKDTRREGIGPFGDYSLDCPTCVLATRTRWDRVPCPVCKGTGEVGVQRSRRLRDVDVQCSACGGSGDLMLRHYGWVDHENRVFVERDIAYPRGLPCVGVILDEMVREEASPPEVWNRGHGTGRVTRPSPWLLAMPLWYELRVEGVEPTSFNGRLRIWKWLFHPHDGYNIAANAILPAWLDCQELRESFNSPEAAHAALNLAVNRLRVKWWRENQPKEVMR